MNIKLESVVWFLCIESFICWVAVFIIGFQLAATATNTHSLLLKEDAILPGAQSQIDELKVEVDGLKELLANVRQ